MVLRPNRLGAAATVLVAGPLAARPPAHRGQPPHPTGAGGSEQVVRAFVDAYDRHDVTAVLALADTGATSDPRTVYWRPISPRSALTDGER
jgi:hypothetical protein